MFFRNLFGLVQPAAPRRRPAPCRLSVEALDDRLVPASLSIGNAAIIEGNAGTTTAAVVVSLDAPSHQTVTVNYGTADGTAVVGGDYQAVSGKLTFAPGETSKTIQVPVIGDRIAEPNESFSVNLSGAKNARIADGQGVVTIVDDEPRFSIGDAAGYVVSSGGVTTGTTLYFTVSLAVAYDQAVTVNYATADDTAVAGVDYLATTGTLTFAQGETTKTIAVQVIGNASGLDESFYVNLSGASNNAQLIDGQGVGTIHYYVEQPYSGGGDCTADSPYYPNC